MKLIIRPFDAAQEFPWLQQLWQSALNSRWQLHPSRLEQTILQSTFSLVAVQNSLPVGFCTAEYRAGQPAGLLAILVDPAFQRQGVGTALLNFLEGCLRDAGVQEFNLGFGTGDYFWPGLPADESKTWKFFEKLGWQEKDRSFDLIQDLERYTTPAWVYGRMTEAGYHLRLADSAIHQQVVAFECACFPVWAKYFSDKLDQELYENVLIAQAPDGSVVGSVLLESKNPLTWTKALGSRCGALSTLGVSPMHQLKGLGLALAARGLELMKERGCSGCYINWTGLVEWYGKLGAIPWAEYQMGSKVL